MDSMDERRTQTKGEEEGKSDTDNDLFYHENGIVYQWPGHVQHLR